MAQVIDAASRPTGRRSTNADSLTLTVSHNGIGITPQLLPFLFEPFVQDTRALGLHGVGWGSGSGWRALRLRRSPDLPRAMRACSGRL